MTTLDEFVAQTFPLEPAPQSASLQPTGQAVSYIVASGGLWRRISLDWIDALLPICTDERLHLPYGKLQPFVNLHVPAPELAFWKRFLQEARGVSPMECAAALIWNTSSRCWRFAMREPVSASSDRIDYREVAVKDDEILLVDIHSHGCHPAFFPNKTIRTITAA